MNWYVNFIEKTKQKFEKKLKKKAEEVCFNLASRYEAKIKKVCLYTHFSLRLIWQ